MIIMAESQNTPIYNSTFSVTEEMKNASIGTICVMPLSNSETDLVMRVKVSSSANTIADWTLVGAIWK